MKANIGKRSNFNIAQDEENLNRPIGTKEIEQSIKRQKTIPFKIG